MIANHSLSQLSYTPDNVLPVRVKYEKSTVRDDAFFEIGGAKEDRTPDLLNAIQALSQLSYNPIGKDNI